MDFLDGIPLVDAHHHFWERGRFPYAWLDGDAPARFGDKAGIRGDFLPPQYLSAFAGLPLSASVHVQANCGASDPAAETHWLQELSRRTGWPTAIVAEADLSKPDAAELIDRHCASPSLRGIRTPVAWDDAGRWRVGDGPDVMQSPDFLANASLLASRDLCLDLVVVPEQLGQVADLARRLPRLQIVLDHFAHLEPDQPGNTDVWRQGISGLAGTDNVTVKLSGLWTVDKGWAPEALAPAWHHARTTLGPDRIMWGSNLPVEQVNCPVAGQMRSLQTLMADLDPVALRQVFSDTARRVYRLPAAP